MGDSDIEDYGFEYSDEDAEEENVDLENQYYNSKGLRDSEPEAAILGFRQVVEMEGSEKGEWYELALRVGGGEGFAFFFSGWFVGWFVGLFFGW